MPAALRTVVKPLGAHPARPGVRLIPPPCTCPTSRPPPPRRHWPRDRRAEFQSPSFHVMRAPKGEVSEAGDSGVPRRS